MFFCHIIKLLKKWGDEWRVTPAFGQIRVTGLVWTFFGISFMFVDFARLNTRTIFFVFCVIKLKIKEGLFLVYLSE